MDLEPVLNSITGTLIRYEATMAKKRKLDSATAYTVVSAGKWRKFKKSRRNDVNYESGECLESFATIIMKEKIEGMSVLFLKNGVKFVQIIIVNLTEKEKIVKESVA